MIRDDSFEASQEFINDLKRVVREASFDRMTRLLYSTDSSIYQIMPYGVVLPRDADEVVAAVKVAGKHGVPVLPRGGGSSLAGQTVGRALILDFSYHMDGILQIDPQARTVRTQPGITLGQLNKRLERYGLMFGPDPASADRATMGGVLGNNASGAHSILYGLAVDHVVDMDVVLADARRVHFGESTLQAWETYSQRSGIEGRVYREMPVILRRYADEIEAHYPGTFRSVSGYNLNHLSGNSMPNLAKLIVGSEGTLGVMTEMTLHLVPAPLRKRLALVHYDHVREALEAVPPLLETQPAAIEAIDKMLLDLTRTGSDYRKMLTLIEGDPQMVLVVEYEGDDDAELDAGIERLRKKLSQLNHKGALVILADASQQEIVWQTRKVGLGILMSMRGDAKPIPFIEDAAVPVEHLADYVAQIDDFAHEVGVGQMAVYAHASAGCMHLRPMIDLKTKTGIAQMRQIAEKSCELVISYSGTTSGEHGEGMARGEFSEKLFGPELTQAFRDVKQVFDPKGLMNPGKVVDVAKMDDESLLRYGSDYATPYEPQSTVFQFRKDHGFAGAVEMCNGAGVCRQLEQGVMCPSFQATRDETHSTRGRANALRAAMMGLLGPEGMSSQELYDVLDLCLSCHACTSECPSSVDMAKLKAEFLYQYYQKHRPSLRSRLFAHFAGLSKFAQPFAPVVNALMRGPGKWALTVLGVHKARSLPRYASQPFSRWYRQHKAQLDGQATATLKQVVFFHDTFMEHNSPRIGEAAIRVLEAAGCEPIILWDRVCCGRPAVSKGFLGEARKAAQHNVRLLAPYAARGIPIVGCEPSCMAMLVDEYPDLVPGEAADDVASVTFLLEEYLVQLANNGHLGLEFDATPRHVLFHGHCQQKASFGTEATRQMLELIPNCTVEEVDSSCCGMAGSFGYEKEHYDLSIKLAEMSLAPAVRSADADTIVCAAGTSCREQIEHTTGKSALHPIEVLAGALRDRNET
jgi:FAD/FMN-containing dehydrogenase/Fe-S oxidoreductase